MTSRPKGQRQTSRSAPRSGSYGQECGAATCARTGDRAFSAEGVAGGCGEHVPETVPRASRAMKSERNTHTGGKGLGFFPWGRNADVQIKASVEKQHKQTATHPLDRKIQRKIRTPWPAGGKDTLMDSQPAAAGRLPDGGPSRPRPLLSPAACGAPAAWTLRAPLWAVALPSLQPLPVLAAESIGPDSGGVGGWEGVRASRRPWMGGGCGWDFAVPRGRAAR